MIRTRRGYTCLLFALLPGVVWHLLRKAWRQPAYLRHLAERFGFFSSVAPGRPVLWLHAVSVGETHAAAPLVKSLQQRYPNCQILLTHMTPTGRAAGEALFGNEVLRCYLPYDFPFAVRRFLRHFRPVAGVLMETEIWFNLVHACQTAGIPLLLVNARLSERSARKYARFGELSRDALRGFAAIAAQTTADAKRLAALGAKQPVVAGNLKFDLEPPPAALEAGARLRALFCEDRPVFLAASTRPGEEALVLDALDGFGVPGLLVVIVPRHPQRFDEVAALLERRSIPYQRRSANRAVTPQVRVVLGDSMGEMVAYYAACDLAFIGGSLLPYGGQNLIEACAVGRPVLIGPHTYNFAEAAERAVEAGAARRVADAAALAREAGQLLRDPAGLVAMGQAGQAFSRQHRGATRQILELLQACLPVQK